VSIYKDAYEARTTIEDALQWLRDVDGWTRDDLDELTVEAIERVYEDDE
jgi:hypothetical protein